MDISKRGNILREVPVAGVVAARFSRPDLREQLYDDAAVDQCSLFRELQETVLSRLAGGDALVLNFGLIERFPTAFYAFLLKLREVMESRTSRLLLCGIRDQHREIFRLYQAEKLFTITDTEEQAVSAASS